MQAQQAVQLDAGDRFWRVQLHQGTGMCVGLDPHYGYGPYTKELYQQFAAPSSEMELFRTLVGQLGRHHRTESSNEELVRFLTGFVLYVMCIIDIAWGEGIRVFKPQAAFYERLGPFGAIALHLVCAHIHMLAARDDEPCFIVLDAKRGDIFTTQDPYYWSYISSLDQEVVPGMNGMYGFDAMTVTTWMGEDVLTPALPFLRNGKAVIVVTRSSNPSGTTFQDALIAPNPEVELIDEQRKFSYTESDHSRLSDLLGREPTACEVMLDQTNTFCIKHELDRPGSLSPIFHVMGSTVPFDDTFRMIRPNAVGLIPGFGAQGGKFVNVTPLALSEGGQKGIIGALSTSRGTCFSWLEKYGGTGRIQDMGTCLRRSIALFRKGEREAYEAAGVEYPFPKAA